MLWYFLGGFALCYAITVIIFGLYDSVRFNWIGEILAGFFYLYVIPFLPLYLLYGFVLKPFWAFFRHVLWPPEWFSQEKLLLFMEKFPPTNKEQKNGKPWIKVLNKHFAIYYNGDKVKKRYAYCLTFIK